MSWLLNVLSKLQRTISSWFDPPYQTIFVQEFLPIKLKKNTLYIVEEDGYQEQAAMLCPCKCGRILHINLLSDERPCWRATYHADGTVTFDPSIWRKKDCGSHFWFRNGRVQWCK